MAKCPSLGVAALLLLASWLLAIGCPATANAREIDLGTALCHATQPQPAMSRRLPQTFHCRGDPQGYQGGTLWLRTDLRPLHVDGHNLALFVHNSRFDAMSVTFRYADGFTATSQIRSGAFGSFWRPGGQIVFEAPVRASPVTVLVLRFDKLASAHLLRMRLMNREDAIFQTTALSATIAAALTLLLVGALYNAGLAIAVRRAFPAWQAAWAGCMVVWGTIWSQFHLFLLPAMAGTLSAQICTGLSCLAVTLATISAVSAIAPSVLPAGLRRMALLSGVAVSLLGVPLSLMRAGPIVEMADLLGDLILGDLALVALCLAFGVRRGSSEARALAGAWSLPMMVLAIVQMIDINALLWGGGAQILILFAAAWQTLWLSIAASRTYARLRADRDSARIAEARAQELARRDPLTGLLNRRGFVETLQRRLSADADRDAPCALLLIDIDRFKDVNDRYGHEAGDQVLVTVAARLARWEGPICDVARLGGEEFALVITGLEGFVLRRFAESVREAIAACRHALAADEVVTASIGVAPGKGPPDFQRLYRIADQALYAAKRSGRNRVVLSSAPFTDPEIAPAGPAVGTGRAARQDVE